MLLGNIATYMKSDQAAGVAYYQRSLEVGERWDTHYFLGKAFSAQKQWREAAAALGAALKMQPANLHTMSELAAAWLQVGETEAREEMGDLEERDPHDPHPIMLLGRAAAQAQNSELALEALRHTTERHPWLAPPMAELAGLIAAAPGATAGGDAAAAEAGACDVADAARLLDPNAALAPAAAALCPPPPSPPPPASVSGPCTMLSAFPALAAHSAADGNACVVRVPRGTAVQLRGPASGIIVPRGAELKVTAKEGGKGDAAVDAGGLSRHFLVAGGTVALDGVTIRGGRALLSSGGAAMVLAGGSLSATDTRFEANRAAYGAGGAVAVRGGKATFTRVVFAENWATWRGGALSLSSYQRAADGTLGESASVGKAVGEATIEGVTYRGNAAGHGAADVQLCCGAEVEGEGVEGDDVDARVCGDEEEGTLSASRLLAIESQVEALEMIERKGLERHGLALLEQATQAEPKSPTAFSSHFTFLYQFGMDAQAAARLSAFKLVRPDHPSIVQTEEIVANRSSAALHQRAKALNGAVGAMRKGLPTPLLYGSKAEAFSATVEAFAHAAALAPDDGELWYDLGTALFFGGEMAEAEQVYSHGASLGGAAKAHEGLRHEAAKAAAFPPVPHPKVPPADAFTDLDFRRVDLA